MSIKKIEQTKSNKFFRLLDIVVYGVALAVTVVLFFMFVIMPDASSLRDTAAVVEITSKGEVVFLFDFGSGDYEILGEGERVSVSAAAAVSVTVYEDADKRGYNIITFDMSGGGRVTAADANCSLRHDCTYMEITESGSSIVCVPHDLIVSVRSAVPPPTTGVAF